jgi:C-terminal processing protease CtpA/Prc
MRSPGRSPGFPACLLSLAAVAFASGGDAVSVATSRERSREMLRDIKAELKRHYYDPTFRGVDLDARFAAADERLAEATSEGMMSAVIAQAVLELRDSHTFFIPPPLSLHVTYGWVMQMVGDVCRIVAVKSGSAAEASGVRPGDAVIAVEGVRPTRDNVWKMNYSLHVLRPRTEVRLAVASEGGPPRDIVVKSDVRPESRLVQFQDYLADLRDRWQRSPNRYAEVGPALVWKLGAFTSAGGGIDEALKKLRGRTGLVLDLRGNGGGAEDVLQKLAGVFTPGEVFGEAHERKGSHKLKADQRHDAFEGKTVVLIDSNSGSASEILARWLQIKKRARVLGDRSAGAVMESEFHSLTQGHEALFTIYGLSVTRASLAMPDGSTLEGVGVTPDDVVVPSAEEMASGQDPVLARAVVDLGGRLDAASAGKLFPRDWERE